jgi:hypothetical protein
MSGCTDAEGTLTLYGHPGLFILSDDGDGDLE